MMSSTTFVLTVIAALVVLMWVVGARKVRIIYPPNVGLLYRNGRFVKELAPGRYTHFDPLGRVHIGEIWTAARPVPLGEIAVVSKDQFAFRLGLSPVVEVTDARAHAESQPPNQFGVMMSHLSLQPLVAAAANEAVAAHALRELMADPKMLSAAIQQKVETALPGARIGQVLLTSITLPPETRRMFTEVERSKLEAEASLERARGEQASLRALANAARLVKDNPALANLRFLQTLERAPGAKTIVLGSDAAMSLAGGSRAEA